MKKAARVVMDVLEVYVPSVTIITLFLAFILQIFSRYVLRAPLVWPYEVAQISYVYAIMLGTCYAERGMENISFSVLYDSLPAVMRKLSDILSNLAVVAVLALSLPSLYGFYQFFMTRFSVVLKIPLGIVYLPYLPFVLITIGRFAARLLRAIRMPVKGYGVSEEVEVVEH